MLNINKLKARYTSMNVSEKIEFIGSILLTVSLIITAVSFISSAVSIYTSGAAVPYSKAVISEHLSRILPISLITDILTGCVGILSLFNKKRKSKPLPQKAKTELAIIERSIGTHASEEYRVFGAKECKIRKSLFFIFSGISLSAIAAASVLVLNPAHYSTADLNTDIAYSTVISGIAALAVLSSVYVYSLLRDRSYSRVAREARILLAELRADGIVTKERTVCEAQANTRTLLFVRCGVIAIACLFITLGILNGGMSDVLGKAVRICTECIGLG